MGLLDRDDQHPGDSREHGTGREHEGIDPAHRHPVGQRHLGVLLRRAHVEPRLALRHRGPDPEQQRDGCPDDDQLVAGVAEPGKHDPEVDGRLDRARIRPVPAQDRLLDDVEQADGGDDGALGVEVLGRADVAMSGDRERAHHQRGEEEREQEASERRALHHRRAEPRQHRAQHVELAVRDVDDAHHPEDQRQPECGDRQDAGGHRAFEQRQQQVRAEAHSAYGGATGTAVCSPLQARTCRLRSTWCAPPRACRPGLRR